ncbi:MAG TPA: alpha/beta hydrolase [Ktedonobacterales bacterium]|nr:alpha/beta hydrolase [Ktedonobacterales bacterium]
MASSSLAQDTTPGAAWTEQFVTANGVRFHTLQAGATDAPLVLFLHGFPEYAYSWRFQLAGLADRYRLVAPDLRGYNLSDKSASGYDVATLATDVRELVFALGVRQAAVVGHDWGGGVAWAAAIREPEVVRRLIIVNAPHPGAMLRELRDPRQMLRSAYMGFFQLRGLAERMIRRNDYAVIRRMFRNADTAHAWLADDDIERYVAAIARPGALSAALEYYRQLPHDLTALSPMRVITAPTLVLWGELDPFLGPELLDDLDAWAIDLTIQRFPTAGHWLNQQEPERVNAAIAAFLEEKR